MAVKEVKPNGLIAEHNWRMRQLPRGLTSAIPQGRFERVTFAIPVSNKSEREMAVLKALRGSST